MLQRILRPSCDPVHRRERLSWFLQLQALVAVNWPAIHEQFESDWRKAASVAAKGYGTPRFTGVCARWLPVDEVLEKNSDENDDYLELLRVEASRLEQTRYIQEIQIRQHGRSLASSLERVEEFRQLARSIERSGIRRPVLLADVAEYDLPYRLYRFDGHHRAICAKHLGIAKLPAFIFQVTPPAPAR